MSNVIKLDDVANLVIIDIRTGKRMPGHYRDVTQAAIECDRLDGQNRLNWGRHIIATKAGCLPRRALCGND